MREQIKLILDVKSLTDSMDAANRITALLKGGYKIVDKQVNETEDYYLEKQEKPEI